MRTSGRRLLPAAPRCRQEAAPVQLGPGELAHARSRRSGSPGTSARTTVPIVVLPDRWPGRPRRDRGREPGHNASKKAEAQRAAVPSWHRLGTAEVVVTNQRLIATGSGRTESLWYAEIGPLQLVPGGEERPGCSSSRRTGRCSGSRRPGRRSSTCSCTSSSTVRRRASDARRTGRTCPAAGPDRLMSVPRGLTSAGRQR